jgi:hypothetical protein
MADNRIKVIIEASVDKARSAVQGFRKDIGDADTATTKAHGGISSKMSGIASATVAGFGVGAIVDFGRQLFSVGSELDTMGKVSETVFGDQIGVVKSWAAQNAASFGTTEDRLVGMASKTQDLLIPMGFQRAEATKLTTDLGNLTGALQAWEGGTRSAQEISLTLNKALLGEREELKGLGISISEADVQQRLLIKGQKDLTGEALAQAKAVATLELITEKSTDAQTAWADGTMDSVKANNESKASIQAVTDELAKELMPAFEKLIPLISEVGLAAADLVGALDEVFGAADKVVGKGSWLSKMFGDSEGGLIEVQQAAIKAAEAYDLFSASQVASGFEARIAATTVKDLTGAVETGTSAYLVYQAGMLGARDAAAEQIEIHKRLADEMDEARNAIERMSGSVSRLKGLLSDRDAYDNAIQAQNELIWANQIAIDTARNQKATEEEKAEALDASKAALRRSIDETLTYIDTVGGIPPSQETIIKAFLDEGKLAEAEAWLAHLARARTAVITAKGQGSLGFMKDDAGGHIPAGEIHEVAEKRPEFVNGVLIGGPADVTSGAETGRILGRMGSGGGGNTIVFAPQISAMDAASFSPAFMQRLMNEFERTMGRTGRVWARS